MKSQFDGLGGDGPRPDALGCSGPHAHSTVGASEGLLVKSARHVGERISQSLNFNGDSSKMHRLVLRLLPINGSDRDFSKKEHNVLTHRQTALPQVFSTMTKL